MIDCNWAGKNSVKSFRRSDVGTTAGRRERIDVLGCGMFVGRKVLFLKFIRIFGFVEDTPSRQKQTKGLIMHPTFRIFES